MSENLEDLTNDQIRRRLVEYGFANLPVTQTTRKVLVKKLRNAMEGEKTKNRRETVAVIKASDDEDVPLKSTKREKTPNRRATIAVSEKTKKVSSTTSVGSNGSQSDAKSSASSRRSSRTTPFTEKPVVTSTNIVTLQDDNSDDDVIEVQMSRRSKSKTPLGTSDIVRTSYKSNIEPVAEDKTEESPESVKSYQRELETRRKTYTSTFEYNDPQPTRTLTPTKISKPSLSTMNYDHHMTSRTLTPTKFGRTTQISTSYNPKFDGGESPDDLDESHTPYLSNFAKRLSTLKAEPLPGMEKYEKLREKDKYADYKPTSSYAYRYTQSNMQSNKPKSSVAYGNFKDIAYTYNSLDQKYNVKKYVYIALIVMLIVAIYVLIFM
jgi:LEM domain